MRWLLEQAMETQDLPRYLPRKGTETIADFSGSAKTTLICHDIYPARGRKHAIAIPHVKSLKICHDIYPARGRKLFLCRRDMSWHDTSFATIFTPQGDGNEWSQLLGQICSASICHDIYPARGRKQIRKEKPENVETLSFATIFTPQGDGNQLIDLEHLYHLWGICHDIYPARGRKHSSVNTQSVMVVTIAICHDIYPARGRKLKGLRIKVIPSFNLPRYLPRKGTETMFLVFPDPCK